MIFIVLGVTSLVLAGVGVFFLVRDAQHQLAGGKPMWQLEDKRRNLSKWIRSNEVFRDVLRSRDDPNWLRVETAIKIKRVEYDAVQKEIERRKVEQAERDALE